jgi:hypothetical protein
MSRLEDLRVVVIAQDAVDSRLARQLERLGAHVTLVTDASAVDHDGLQEAGRPGMSSLALSFIRPEAAGILQRLGRQSDCIIDGLGVWPKAEHPASEQHSTHGDILVLDVSPAAARPDLGSAKKRQAVAGENDPEVDSVSLLFDVIAVLASRRRGRVALSPRPQCHQRPPESGLTDLKILDYLGMSGSQIRCMASESVLGRVLTI